MITLVLGRQGSGKTLFLVKKGYEAYKKGIPVYANFVLNFPFTKLTYEDIVNCKYSNGVCLIDEVHLLLSARRSMAKLNRLICDGFLSMVRKKGLDVYGTTQMERKVDIRFREEADFMIWCTKYAYSGKQWTLVFRNENLRPNIPIMVKMEVMETYSNNVIESAFIGNPYFTLFNTVELIQIRPIEDLITKISKGVKAK